MLSGSMHSMELSEIDQLSEIEMRAILYALAQDRPGDARRLVNEVTAITRGTS